MILSVTLSKPVNSISEILDKPYEKIKIKIENYELALKVLEENGIEI